MPYPYNYPNYSAFNPALSYAPQNFSAQPVQPPAQPQTTQSGVNGQSGFVCRPVTSRAEAEVYQIPFDGSTTYFVDTANGKIYSKTFNFANGTAPLVTYIREEEVPAVQYVTADVVETLRGEIETLREEIESLKKTKKAVKRNDESDVE